MSNNGADPLVKIIVTRFVQTDETQFKSVVQNLTGKDSVVAMEPESGWRANGAGRGRAQTRGKDGSGGRRPGSTPVAGTGELERMIMELPSLEELRGLLAD